MQGNREQVLNALKFSCQHQGSFALPAISAPPSTPNLGMTLSAIIANVTINVMISSLPS
jgi:hypothetical protein